MADTVAVVLPDVTVPGGVTSVAVFLHEVLQQSERYEPELVSLALSSRDSASLRLVRPTSWFHGEKTERRRWEGISYRHVGARGAELEFQRYRSRPALTDILQEYDLIQIVAGTPPWAHVARHVEVPVALQVATLTEVERNGMDPEVSAPKRMWRSGMTRIASRMEDAVPSLVDAIFVENTWMYQHYQDVADPSIVHFAPPGTDTTVFHPGSHEEKAGDYILSVGRWIDSRKNVRLLFEAYGKLRETLPDPPRLILAGLSGPTDADWAYAERIGVRSHIEMREDVPQEELAELYRNARLFALSSNEEGLGLVLAEAMASGVPVVSTDCGGPSTLIDDGETGYLVPVRDAEALADRMAHLLMHPDHANAMGEAGRRRIENNFSNEAAGERFLDVYDQLLA